MAMALPFVLLINPVAGQGDGRRIGEEIEKALRALGADYEYMTGSPEAGHISQHPGQTVRQVLVVGGDGTLRAVAEGLVGQPVEVVMVPAGRGNDFARMLGLPIGADPESLWKLALTATAPEAELIRSDVWECNGKIFINGAGFGFEARVVAKMIGGRRSYYWQAARQALRWVPFTADIHTDEGRMTCELTNLSLMNGVFAGGGFRLAPLAKLDDGKLDLIAVGGMHPWEKMIYLPLVRRGAHLKMKGVSFRQVTQMRMICDRDLPWHVDGELMNSAREFVITRRSETMLFRRPKPQTGARA